MFLINLALSLMIQSSLAAESCSTVFGKAIKPVFAEVEGPKTPADLNGQRYQYITGSKHQVLDADKSGRIRFFSDNYLAEYDPATKAVTTLHRFHRYSFIYRSPSNPELFVEVKDAADFKINKLTRVGFKTLMDGSFAYRGEGPSIGRDQWYSSVNYRPPLFLYKGEVLALERSYTRSHALQVGYIQGRHLEIFEVPLPHIQFSGPLVVGKTAYYVDTNKNKIVAVNLLDRTTQQLSLRGEKIRDLTFTKAATLSDGSALLTGVFGFTVIAKDGSKVLRQFIFNDHGQEVSARPVGQERNYEYFVDVYNDKVAYWTGVKDGKPADVHVVDAKTGEVKDYPIQEELTNLVLADDGVVIVSYAKKVVVFNKEGHEIASHVLPADGQKGRFGQLVKMDGKTVLFMDAWADSILSIKW